MAADHGIRPDGRKMRQLREERGWTQEELAERVGYSKRTIENAEAGRRVRWKTLQDFAQALNVLPIYLVLTGDSPAEAKPRPPARLTDPAIDLDAHPSATPVPPTAPASSGAPPPAPRRKHTLLVVDDDTYNFVGIIGHYKDEFTIYTAKSADEAERVFERDAIDLILTDQRMPGRSGVELLEWVRTRSPRTIGLLMTGFAEYDDLEAAVNRGHIYHVVPKPWKTDDMRRTLRNAAEKFDLERRYEQLVAELSALNEELEQRVSDRTRELELLALTDPLTGLFNRRATVQLAGQEVKRHARYPNALALGILDVDYFKNVNTVHGYPGGDIVLVALAQVLSSQVRDTDSVGRMGGEEFLVIARETDAAGAQKQADRILKTVADTEIAFEGQQIKVTMSAGFAVAGPGVPATYEELYKIASATVQEAKDAGRNRCVVRCL